MTILLVHATAAEGARVAAARPAETLRTGAGKAAAAAAVARALAAGPRPQAVILFGVCGVYPDSDPGPALGVGDLCLVGRDRLADEGIAAEDGFRSLADLGLGETGPFAADAALTERAARRLGGVPIVDGATVSTCSASAHASAALARRTGARVETMEGAAVALACREPGVPLVQIRCVSNRTGDRARAGWDLRRAAQRVQDAVLALVEGGWP